MPAEIRKGCCVAAVNSSDEDSSNELVSLVANGGGGFGDAARSRSISDLQSEVRSVSRRWHETRVDLVDLSNEGEVS